MSDTLLMLLEMIEEVLEEQSKHPKSNEVFAAIKAKFPNLPIEDISKSPARIVIDKTGGKRSEIMAHLGARPEGNKRQDKFGILPDGSKIELRHGGQRGVGNPSEKFEGNLIIALNGSTPSGFEPNKDYLADPTEQSKADSVIKSIGRSRIKGAKFIKVPDANEVTPLYQFFSTRKPKPTSKTDIGSNGSRISVKESGASLLSSEVAETCAIFAAILGYDPDKNPTGEIAKFITKIQTMLSKQNIAKRKTSQDKRQLFDEVLLEIYDFFYSETRLNNPNFKTNFIIEAMTGNKRFAPNSPQIAVELLKWDHAGKGEYYDSISGWATENTDLVAFDVRWRGSGRSGGVRLDRWVSSRLNTRNVFYRMYDKYGAMQTEGEVIDLGITEMDLAESLLDFIKATIVDVTSTSKGIEVGILINPEAADAPAPDNVVALPTSTGEPLRRVAEQSEET